MPAIVVNRDYYLKVNNIALACPAWQVTDLGPLFDDPAIRGNDEVMPYVSGRVSYIRRVDATVLTFPLEIIGSRDTDGSSLSPASGLIAHVDFLKANLGLASSTGDGTVPLAFHRGAAATKTASGHFLGFKGSKILNPGVMLTTFDISVPAGAWV